MALKGPQSNKYLSLLASKGGYFPREELEID